MICINCQNELEVSNSRPQKSRNQTWRRRLCNACGAVYTSIEALDLSKALSVSAASVSDQRQVIRKSGQPGINKSQTVAKMSALQPFDRDRLFISVYMSLRHRPTASRDARGLADTITAQLITGAKNGVVNRRTIADTILNTLSRFDTAAASHYGAFHRL